MTVKRVGVVGTGIMGAGIAECAARGGFEVVARARTSESARALVERLARSLDRQVAKGTLEAEEAAAALARVTVTCDLAGLAACDLVIESIAEDLEAKKQLFADLDHVCTPDAILASNTSTFPVVELAMETHRPHQVCGLHFFNPAPAMALVEIAAPLTADEATISAARAFAEACGKQAVVVADRAGFVVNALLFPYLNHAVRLLDAGVASRDDIDRAMVGACNHPMGPLALLDLVGLDTAVAILDALYDEYRDPTMAPAPLLRRMVAAGRLGRKNGRGFYDHEPRKA